MNIPVQALRRNVRLVCAGAIGATLFVFSSLQAATPVAIGFNVVKGQTTTTHKSDTNKNGTKTDTTTNEQYYTLSLLNPSDTPLAGMSIEYHIYNRNSDTSNGKSTTSVDDVTGTATLDLAPHAKKDIETTHAPHQDVTITPGGKNGVKSAGNQESHRQAVMGIYVVVKKGTQEIKRYEDPDGLRDQVAKITGKDK